MSPIALSSVFGRKLSSGGSTGAGEVLGSCGKELVGYEGLVLGEAEELVVAVFKELHRRGAVVVEGLGVFQMLGGPVVLLLLV